MKRILIALTVLVALLAVGGCGGGGEDRGPIRAEIFSDETVDGDIRRDPGGLLTITEVTRDATPRVRAGINPNTLQEFRAFLDFPLNNTILNSRIQSATLNLVINTITPLAATVPIRIDLVDFAPPLIGTDFDRGILPALATTTINPPITSADLDQNVPVDVTSLLLEAQLRRLPSFQVRIMEDFGFVEAGLIEIDDGPLANRAPLLQVTFF